MDRSGSHFDTTPLCSSSKTRRGGGLGLARRLPRSFDPLQPTSPPGSQPDVPPGKLDLANSSLESLQIKRFAWTLKLPMKRALTDQNCGAITACKAHQGPGDLLMAKHSQKCEVQFVGQ